MALNQFIDYLQSLSPAMATLLLRGGVETLDSYNRPRVLVGGTTGPVWRRNKKGYAYGQTQSGTPAGGGSLSIANSGAAPELQALSGTIFWTAQNFVSSAVDVVGGVRARVFSAADAGGTNLDVMVWAASQLAISDGTRIRIIAHSVLTTGLKSGAIRFVSGAIPQFFADGVYRVNASGTLVPPNNDADLYLMGYYSSQTYCSKANNYQLIALFNDAILGRALTDAEIKNLHELWDQIGSVFEPKRTIFLPPDPMKITGSLPLVYFAGPKNANSIVPNLGSLETDFTISGCLQQRSDKGHIIHSAPGRGGANGPLTQTPVDARLYPDPWTVSFKCIWRSAGEGSGGRVFDVDISGSTRNYLYGGAGIAYYSVSYSDGLAFWGFPCTFGQSHIVSVRHNKSNPANLPSVTVDGKSVVVSVVVAKAGALSAAASPKLSLFNFNNPAVSARAFDGELEIFRMDSGLLTDAQVRQIYLDHALECNVLAHRTDHPVSVAAVAAGGNCGPVRVLSGTMKWDDDGTRRRLLGVTAGYFASREASPQAYGAWYCRASKGTDGDTILIPLMASIPKALSAATQNGYAIWLDSTEAVVIRKYTNGGAAAVAQTAAGAIVVGTEYELFTTRQSVATADGNAAGFFTVWIRGGAYATWTSLLTGTDDTHKTSNCLVGYLDPGGYISDYRQYPNGSGLVPTDVPGLED